MKHPSEDREYEAEAPENTQDLTERRASIEDRLRKSPGAVFGPVLFRARMTATLTRTKLGVTMRKNHGQPPPHRDPERSKKR